MPYSVLNFSKQNVGVPYNGIGVGASIETTNSSLCPGKPPTGCMQASPCSSSSPCTPASCCLSPIPQGGNQILKCNFSSPVSCTGGKCSSSAPPPPPPPPPPPSYRHASIAACNSVSCGGEKAWDCPNDVGKLGTYEWQSGTVPMICCPSASGTGGEGKPVWALACNTNGNCANAHGQSTDENLSWACPDNPVVGKYKYKIPSLPWWECPGTSCTTAPSGTWCSWYDGYTCCPDNPNQNWWPDVSGSTNRYHVSGNACIKFPGT